MFTLKIIPIDDSRTGAAFIEVRKAISKVDALMRDEDHDPTEARLVMDELAMAWLSYREGMPITDMI